MSVKVIGLDIAKHVFQLHGADARGKAVLKKRLRRDQLTDFFGSIPRCRVAMEATRVWVRRMQTGSWSCQLSSRSTQIHNAWLGVKSVSVFRATSTASSSGSMGRKCRAGRDGSRANTHPMLR